jgi:ABC-type phosphate/phosphonate transport system substrate-binding protein
MRSITLFVPAAREVVEPVMIGLQKVLRATSGMDLSPMYVSTAALLPPLLDVARDAAAWSPSFTAYVLQRTQLATPIVAPVRRFSIPHHAMIVARSGVDCLASLAGKRIGWVSKLSVTGYEIPRLYLESFGNDVDTLFAEQRFCGSHRAAARALARGEVDLVATHAVHAEALTFTTGARILVSIGPIPSDVIVAGTEMPPAVREALAEGLSGMRGFARAKGTHLRIFDVLSPQTEGSGAFAFGMAPPLPGGRPRLLA